MDLLGFWVFAHLLQGLYYAWLPLGFLTSYLVYLLWILSLHTIACLASQSVGLGHYLLAMNIMPKQTTPHVGRHQHAIKRPGVHKSKQGPDNIDC